MLAMRLAMFLISLTLLAQPRPIPVDNEWTRAVLATARPGPKGRLHKHDMNRVMIYLDKGTQVLEYENGPVKTISAEAGEIQFDPRGGMHTSAIPGNREFRIVEIELRKEGGPVTWPKDDPVKIAPKVYKVELDNSQVRILRVKLAPHQKIPEHEHALNRILVPLTEIDMAVTASDGKTTHTTGKSGDVLPGKPVRHREENTLDKPVEYIIVEFKD